MGPKPKYIPRYLKKFGAAFLSRPRGLAGRISVGRRPPAIAIASESRHHAPVFLEDGASGLQEVPELGSCALIFDTILTELARLLIVI
jgi:hypothetical protein